MIKVIKFENPTCKPCKEVEKILQAIKTTLDFELVNVDTYTDDGAELAQVYHVMSTPTVVIEKDGVMVDKIISLQAGVEYRERISSFM
jgi:thioredoxin-like negative regulator of GroEL